MLEKVIENGSVESAIRVQFTFERNQTREDFVSLLFYLELLTVQTASYGQWVLQIPNRVIAGLYYKFFQYVLLHRSKLADADLRVGGRTLKLVLDNDIEPLREAFQHVLRHLGNRGARRMDEKHLKTALIALMSPTGVYMVRSEPASGKGHPDTVPLRRPPILEPKRQYVFELKYLNQEGRGTPPAGGSERGSDAVAAPPVAPGGGGSGRFCSVSLGGHRLHHRARRRGKPGGQQHLIAEQKRRTSLSFQRFFSQ